MVRRLFQNYFSQLYHISLSCSFISHPLFGIICCWFSIPLFLDIWRSERDCRLNVYSVGWTHYSVHSTHYSVGCRHYSIGCTLYSVGCICRLDALLCRLGTMHYWAVSCKHILCRLYTLQTGLSVVHNARSVANIYSVGCTHYSDHSPFLGKSLKKTR